MFKKVNLFVVGSGFKTCHNQVHHSAYGGSFELKVCYVRETGLETKIDYFKKVNRILKELIS